MYLFDRRRQKKVISKTTDIITKYLIKIFGALLLLLPFLYLPDFFGAIKGYSAVLTPAFWMIGVCLVSVIAWFVCLVSKDKLSLIYDSFFNFLESERRIFVFICFAILLACLTFFSSSVFNFRPHNVDSVAQMFQARIFTSGRFLLPSFEHPEFFSTLNTINDSSGWYSQYPPGHSAILAFGLLLGIEKFLPALLSFGSVIFFYLFMKNMFDSRSAQVALLLSVVCPFFLFMGAGYMNHVSALFFISAAYYFFSKWYLFGKHVDIFVGGVMFGGVFLSRPLDAFALGLPLALIIISRIIRKKASWITIPFGLLGFMPFVGLFLAYNQRTTGNAFLTGYTKLWGEQHGLGFHTNPWGIQHTPLVGFRNQLTDLSLLGEFLFEWPIPSLLPIAFFFLFARKLSNEDKTLILSFLMLPCVYFFYWHRDAYFGPRFFYSGVLFLVAITARSVVWMHEELRDKKIKIPGLFSEVSLSIFAITICALCVCFSLSMGIAQRYKAYSSSYSSMKLDYSKLAKDKGITTGIVFIPVSWGNRMISSLRSLGVSPSLVEHAYGAIDHCLLDSLIKKSFRESSSVKKIEKEVKALIAKKHEVVKVNITDDTSLRLRKNIPLSAECIDEVRYDKKGFANYTPALHESLPEASTSVIFARDLRDRNVLLEKYFPNRNAYILRGKSFETL